MAITFVAAAAMAGNAIAITPALPAGIATGDILILFMRTSNGQASSIANAAGGTWTEFTNSPQDNTAGTVQGTWFWSRYNGTQTAPTTNDSGAINIGVILAWRGCIATGDPFDVTAGGIQSGSISMSNPGLTTTVDGCMIVVSSVCDRDAVSTTNATDWANASLVSIDEVFDETIADAAGGGHAIANGIKTSAGVVSATTWTQGSTAGTADLTIALKPAVGAATVDPYPYVGGGYYPTEG